MTVTRKNYEAVAEAVREAWLDVFGPEEPDDRGTARALQERIRVRLAAHPGFGGANPAFDVQKFMLASDGPKKARILKSVQS